MPSNLSLQNLNLKEKIAQLFIMGFRGSDISSNSEILQTVAQHKPGGVILFDKDMVHHQPVHNIQSPTQVKDLTSSLQEASKEPLLIGIDQEGGLVNRLKAEYGFPDTKSHQSLGEINDVETTFKEASGIADTLNECGINLNFAPVVDLAKNPNSSIIAKRERTFGKTVGQVIRHAEAYIKAHQEKNIITCCKHFPGHGSAEGDTHAGFVNVTDTWNKEEIEPYRYLIEVGNCPMIMTAHIFNSKLDDQYPSTLSKKVLTDLLRGELEFEGVIISDDMQMRAISDHFGIKEALKLGLNAGLDIFCFGNNLLREQILIEDLIEMILELIEEEAITLTRIDESVQRILNLKNQYLLKPGS